MKILVAAISLAIVTCSAPPPAAPAAPLFRIQGEWEYPPPELENPTRTAPATVIVFYPDGQYLEHHFFAIEEQDKTIVMSAGDPHVVIVGTWRQAGARITATRKRIQRTVPAVGRQDPVCSEPIMTFRIQGNGVVGRAGASVNGSYVPNPSLRLPPDFDAYTREAMASSVQCGT